MVKYKINCNHLTRTGVWEWLRIKDRKIKNGETTHIL